MYRVYDVMLMPYLHISHQQIKRNINSTKHKSLNVVFCLLDTNVQQLTHHLYFTDNEACRTYYIQTFNE